MSWEAISGISSAVQTVIIFVAAVLALWQLRESLTARQMSGFLRIIDELEHASTRQTRRFFATHRSEIAEIAKGGSLDRLDRFIRRRTRSSAEPLSLVKVQDSFASLEHIAMLSLNSMLPAKLEQAYVPTIVVRTWPNIKPVVLMLRRELGAPYLQHFEALYEVCISGAIYQRNYGHVSRHAVRRMMANSKSFALKNQ